MVISTYYYHHYSFFSDVIVDHRDSQVQSRSWIETQLVEKENLFVNVFNWIWPSKQPEGRKRERVRSILINAHRKSLLLYIFWLINDKLVQMIKRKWETKIGFRGGGESSAELKSPFLDMLETSGDQEIPLQNRPCSIGTLFMPFSPLWNFPGYMCPSSATFWRASQEFLLENKLHICHGKFIALKEFAYEGNSWTTASPCFGILHLQGQGFLS